jgi:PncC family amidohydrolase
MADDDMSLARLLVEKCGALSLRIVLAESCTAGLAADLIARIPGASLVLWGSFVTYTVDAKADMLGLDRNTIEKNGAVSRETACAMAEGALAKSGAQLSAAVTGLAGPGGDGTPVPVGTVWIATARKGRETSASVFHFSGSRDEVRRAAASSLLKELLKYIP